MDFSFQQDNMYRRMRRLICFDMDSTLIETEVIDELAIRAGVGAFPFTGSVFFVFLYPMSRIVAIDYGRKRTGRKPHSSWKSILGEQIILFLLSPIIFSSFSNLGFLPYEMYCSLSQKVPPS